jgi:Antibiotic biosynthesis monooxygenase
VSHTYPAESDAVIERATEAEQGLGSTGCRSDRGWRRRRLLGRILGSTHCLGTRGGGYSSVSTVASYIRAATVVTGSADAAAAFDPATMAGTGHAGSAAGVPRVHPSMSALNTGTRACYARLSFHQIACRPGRRHRPGNRTKGRNPDRLASRLAQPCRRIKDMNTSQTGFAVIYRFKVAAESEGRFISAWERMTEMIRDHRGGRGSRLHRGDDGIIYAYAQWPDRTTFEADTELPAEAAPLLEVMSQATLERPPTIYLTTIADLLLPEG